MAGTAPGHCSSNTAGSWPACTAVMAPRVRDAITQLIDPDITLSSAGMPAWFPHLPGMSMVIEIAGNTANEIDSLLGICKK